MDLPADLIKGVVEDAEDVTETAPVPDAPKDGVEEARLFKVCPIDQIGEGAFWW